MADDDQVTLESQDNVPFKVFVNVARMSDTIKNLIEDAGVEMAIPLPNVTGKVLGKVVEYCKYHTEHPTVVAEATKEEKRTDDIIDWDKTFCNIQQAELFELILAANYLDIKGLLDLTCKTVANMIKGKTPEEIRAKFGIKEAFTADEERQVREENAWCEER